MASQALALEALHQPGEAIALGIYIGIVDLVGVAREHEFGSFPHTGDDGFHLMGREVLGLIHHHVLAGDGATADVADGFHFQQSHPLQIRPAVAWGALASTGAAVAVTGPEQEI